MNLKPYLKQAWNEPRRFFFFLTVLCAVGLGVAFIVQTNTTNYQPPNAAQTFALFCLLILALGVVIGILGFILSWIPPMHRLFVALLRRRFFILACLITVVALFYAVENWRGKYAWEKYKRQQEAKGERFDYKSIAPSPVPDSQNFAMTPIFVEEISGMMGAEKAAKWYGEKVGALGRTNFIRRLDMPIELQGRGFDLTNKNVGWPNAEPFDLKVWQDYYRRISSATNFFPSAPQPQTSAEDVLLALSKYESNLEELRRASELPYARFPVSYGDENPAGILLPHLSSLKHITTTLRLRAIAELAGDSDKALGDVKLMFRLMEAIRSEPILISHLVRVAMLQITLQPVWEGLAAHKWNETQLAKLADELAKTDFLADYNFAMRGERAFGIGIIDYLQRNRHEIDNIGEPSLTGDAAPSGQGDFEKMIAKIPGRLIPSGWFQQNKIAIAQMHERYLLPIVNVETRSISIAMQQQASRAVAATKLTPYNWFTRLLLPALSGVPHRCARAQSSLDLARVAVALERHRLANGAFPETLDVLAPQFLPRIPHDIMNGEPLRYRRASDGKFVLYSVGWNETDDEGKIILSKGSTPSVDFKKGDWVWKYPAQ